MYKGLKENYRELAFKTQKSVEESAKKFPSYGEEANFLFINDFAYLLLEVHSFSNISFSSACKRCRNYKSAN